MLQCFNPSCQSTAATTAARCKVCGTPLVHRFLLALTDRPLEVEAGGLVAGRFLVWGDGPQSGDHRLWLDTRPETPTPALDIVPSAVGPYLKLFHLAQHLPRPYAYLMPEQSGLAEPVLLLDAAPVAVRLEADPGPAGRVTAALLPSLEVAWTGGSALQQIHWLRQMAALWEPLAEQQVAQTLLQLDQVRVDGALLRLTSLVGEGDRSALAPSALSQPWRRLVAAAQPAIAAYLAWLVEALALGELTSAAALEAELEGAIQALALGLKVTVDWTADTDRGPTRDRNEDACYPRQQEHRQRMAGTALGTEPAPLLLVCDGIGGHEQGNVASQTAIQLLQQELEPLTQANTLPPGTVTQRLQRAIVLANDAIAARNNDENRSARARMGTTVVAALVHFPYLYVAHVGDSRAYRISPHTGYQITVDDDVASRETQMGYALYPEAVQSPSGGALVQALGISDSAQLHPSVQRLLLDDAQVLLLCSDGLSDYDRVDALAPLLVAPLVAPPKPLAPAVAELVQQANRLNGHDNVTVGLLRVTPHGGPLPTLPGRSQRSPAAPHGIDPGPPMPEPTAASWRSPWPWLVLLGGAAALGGVGAWTLGQRQAPVALQSVASLWPSTALAGGALASAALAATVEVPVGSYWQVAGGGDRPFPLHPQPTADAPSLTTVPAGGILWVVSRQTTAAGLSWIRLRLCSIPAGSSFGSAPQESATAPPPPAPDLAQQLATPGTEGWTEARQLYTAAAFLDLVTPDQAGICLP